MFGGSGKMGRGGGGGKRSIHAPPINRTGRPSMGDGPRGRSGATSAAVSSSPSMQVDESFSLVRENPLSFGMVVKLAPDLVEEIKRLEEQGSGKFDVVVPVVAAKSGDAPHIAAMKEEKKEEPAEESDSDSHFKPFFG